MSFTKYSGGWYLNSSIMYDGSRTMYQQLRIAIRQKSNNTVTVYWSVSTEGSRGNYNYYIAYTNASNPCYVNINGSRVHTDSGSYVLSKNYNNTGYYLYNGWVYPDSPYASYGSPSLLSVSGKSSGKCYVNIRADSWLCGSFEKTTDANGRISFSSDAAFMLAHEWTHSTNNNKYTWNDTFSDQVLVPITYNANKSHCNNEGVAGTTGTQYYSLGNVSITNSLHTSHYTFNGWNTRADGKGTTYKVGSTYSSNAPITLYAQWKPKTYLYDIIYNINNSYCNNETITGNNKTIHVTTTYGTVSTSKIDYSLSTNHYTFSGWNTKADGSGTSYAINSTYGLPQYNTGNSIRLYAQWKPKIYYIQILSDGIQADLKQVTYNTKFTINTLSKMGYTQVGWSPLSTFTNTYTLTQNLITIPSNTSTYIVISAKWQANTYTITQMPFTGNNTKTTPIKYDSNIVLDTSYTGDIPSYVELVGWSVGNQWNTLLPNSIVNYAITAGPGADSTYNTYALWVKQYKSYALVDNTGYYNGARRPYKFAQNIVLYPIVKYKSLLYVKTSNGWKLTIPYVKTSTGWKSALAYTKTSSGWKL